MENISTQEKIRKLEMELESIKRLATGRPDFGVDEKNWTKVEKASKKTRKRNYRVQYGSK